MNLKSFSEYKLGNTPIYCAQRYCSGGHLFLKLESYNMLGSIKDRTAYYIIKDLIDEGKLHKDISLVESSSGNLGIALSYFSREVGIHFLCLVDPTLPKAKIDELIKLNVEFEIVSRENHPDCRSARICRARELDQDEAWIWTNQYDNLSNCKSHYETTGPEIWSQMGGAIDYLICSVGTGGTICGVGKFLKDQKPSIKVVAVEPFGSTIFGGEPDEYLSVGAGMHHPTAIITKHDNVIDMYCHVPDLQSLFECAKFQNLESFSVGVTTGSVLAVARQLASDNPNKNIVGISPDNGDKYIDLINGTTCTEFSAVEMSQRVTIMQR